MPSLLDAMSTPTIIICINGIRTKPGQTDAWTDEMAAALNLRTPPHVKTATFEYYSTALFRWMGQRSRAAELTRRCRQYAEQGFRVVLIGHSNGCDLIARTLNAGVPVHSAHLFAAAAFERDFTRAIASGVIGRLHLYGSPNDAVLKQAEWSERLVGWLGLGYGSLGLRGKEFATQYPAHVRDHSIPVYGHSTWFVKGSLFEKTVSMVLKHFTEDLTEL